MPEKKIQQLSSGVQSQVTGAGHLAWSLKFRTGLKLWTFEK